MSAVWIKILTMIHEVNLIIESRYATLDVEMMNIILLQGDIKNLREKWDDILKEARYVSNNLSVSDSFEINSRLRSSYSSQEEAEDNVRVNVFYNIIDYVIDGLSRRFSEAKNICELFDFLWQFKRFNENELSKKTIHFQLKYSRHVSNDIESEILLLERIFDVNFKIDKVAPKNIFEQILKLRLSDVFRMFLLY